MQAEIPTEERILREHARLGMEDRLQFRCEPGLDCFTDCCRDVAIVLTPYDIIRLKRALGIDSSEFLTRHTISPFTREQKFPMVILKMEPESGRCPFVNEQGCQVYAHRPWACRMYPLGIAEPKNPTPTDRGFHFLIREELCHGHGRGDGCTVREWLAWQGIEEYELLGASYRFLTLHDFWDGDKALTPQQMDMFHMACYDIDRFRRFVFETRFLELFEVDETRVEALRTDDVELLELATQWLRFGLFQERAVKIRPSVLEARRG